MSLVRAFAAAFGAPFAQELAAGAELLYAVIAAVSHVYVLLLIHCDRMGPVELAFAAAFAAPLVQELAAGGKLLYLIYLPDDGHIHVSPLAHRDIARFEVRAFFANFALEVLPNAFRHAALGPIDALVMYREL